MCALSHAWPDESRHNSIDIHRRGGRTMRLSRTLLVWAMMLPAWCLAADEPPVIPLWPAGAPGSEGKTDPEVVDETGKNGVHDRHISRVHNPTLDGLSASARQGQRRGGRDLPRGRAPDPGDRPRGIRRRQVPQQHRRGGYRAQVPPGEDRGRRLQGRCPCPGRRPARDAAGPQPRRRLGDRPEAGSA